MNRKFEAANPPLPFWGKRATPPAHPHPNLPPLKRGKGFLDRSCLFCLRASFTSALSTPSVLQRESKHSPTHSLSFLCREIGDKPRVKKEFPSPAFAGEGQGGGGFQSLQQLVKALKIFYSPFLLCALLCGKGKPCSSAKAARAFSTSLRRMQAGRCLVCSGCACRYA